MILREELIAKVAPLSHIIALYHTEPSVMAFKKATQNFTTTDPTYTIPVVRTRSPETPATVKWRTKKAQRFELSGPLKFSPRETEKNIVIDPKAYPGPIQPETFQLELFDPSTNASIGDKKTTVVNVTDGGKCVEVMLSELLVPQTHSSKDLLKWHLRSFNHCETELLQVCLSGNSFQSPQFQDLLK